MTEFRGVQQDALVDSFKRAQSFLQGLSLGEGTESVLKKWDAGNAADKITTAKTDKELAGVMRATSALPMLSHYRDVFFVHAAAEAAEGKGHEVQDLYRDLMSWGAFFDETAAPDAKVDKEVRTHAILQALGRLSSADPAVVNEDGLESTVELLKGKDERLAEWLETALPTCRLLNDCEQTDAIEALLSGTTNTQDSYMARTLYGMSDLEKAAVAIKAPGAMAFYRTSLSNQEGVVDNILPPAEWGQRVGEVRKELLKAMIPYLEVAQFGKVDILPATKEQDKFNISFYATKSVAQVAAAKLQELGCTLYDAGGHAVQPPTSGPAKDSPSPAGP